MDQSFWSLVEAVEAGPAESASGLQAEGERDPSQPQPTPVENPIGLPQPALPELSRLKRTLGFGNPVPFMATAHTMSTFEKEHVLLQLHCMGLLVSPWSQVLEELWATEILELVCSRAVAL